MKKQNGITLIALIITVIVMLILVAVTVSIALNGGIFDQARTATKDTNKASARETVQAALVGSYDPVTGEIDASKLGTNLGNEWTVAAGENSIICTKQNSAEDEETTIFFEISKNGTIIESELELERPEEINEYGFYYNTEYVTHGFKKENDTVKVKISKICS